MADVNMTPLGGTGQPEDRFLVCEGMPGIKKCSVRGIHAGGGNTLLNLEFPEIGHSLPAIIDSSAFSFLVFAYGNVAAGSVPESITVSVLEYGGQPDPDYFNITGVDEEGNPVYLANIPQSKEAEQKLNGKSISSLSVGN